MKPASGSKLSTTGRVYINFAAVLSPGSVVILVCQAGGCTGYRRPRKFFTYHSTPLAERLTSCNLHSTSQLLC